LKAFEPDFVKVVSTARTLADNLAVLKLIEDHSLASHVVGIAMGEEGLVSRVLGRERGLRSLLPRLTMGRRPLRGR